MNQPAASLRRMNSDTSILKKISIVFAIAGLLGGVLFTAYHGYQLGYELKHLHWSFNAFQPIPDDIEFPHSYLSPYVLVALAALLSCSRQSAWTSLISTLLILYVGGATYQSLLRSGVPSINDITNVNLPIQGYLAWIALFTAGWGLVSRLKGMLTQKPRALQSPAQSPP
jgi:hypothetical protein